MKSFPPTVGPRVAGRKRGVRARRRTRRRRVPRLVVVVVALNLFQQTLSRHLSATTPVPRRRHSSRRAFDGRRRTEGRPPRRPRGPLAGPRLGRDLGRGGGGVRGARARARRRVVRLIDVGGGVRHGGRRVIGRLAIGRLAPTSAPRALHAAPDLGRDGERPRRHPPGPRRVLRAGGDLEARARARRSARGAAVAGHHRGQLPRARRGRQAPPHRRRGEAPVPRAPPRARGDHRRGRGRR